MSAYWIRYRGTHFPLRRAETTIGRSAYCTIVLSNELASREHCVLHLSDTRLSISDLSSRNGTFVNGKRVSAPVALKPGDVIRVGSDTLEVVDSDAPRRRAQCNTGSDFDLDEPSTQIDATTSSHISVVESLEALTLLSAQGEQAQGVAEIVKKAVDMLLESPQPGQLHPAQRVRLLRVVERIAGSLPGDGAGWMESVKARMEASPP